MIRLVLVCVLTGLVSACKNDQFIQLKNADYLVFGHFYGECIGEQCIEIFRLEKDQLLEDRRDRYPRADEFYVGDFVQLTPQQFAATKDLINYFPQNLLSEKTNVIGQPDAGDWGGLYIEYSYDGVRKYWLLDKMKTNVPAKYHAFIDKVNEKIRQLR